MWGRLRVVRMARSSARWPSVSTGSVVIIVTLADCLGDVLGADHAVAMGFADLDAFVGQRGFEVGGTPAFVGGGVEFGQSGEDDLGSYPTFSAKYLVDVG